MSTPVQNEIIKTKEESQARYFMDGPSPENFVISTFKSFIMRVQTTKHGPRIEEGEVIKAK